MFNGVRFARHPPDELKLNRADVEELAGERRQQIRRQRAQRDEPHAREIRHGAVDGGQGPQRGHRHGGDDEGAGRPPQVGVASPDAHHIRGDLAGDVVGVLGVVQEEHG